ncbi:hypothetical protein F2Q69_00050668 [Brassica cretica]|uniref:Uncharacterized protein n=1 Tax=Brassica cretica TaxID=69181 RepID=A0A8S9PW70_BRACR|nr:hypothetical protein F2Q69_00050668 [Brassica cretica]
MVISKSTAKIIILANSSRKKDRKNTNTYGRGSPERSVRKESGQDLRTGPFSLVRLAHRRGRPAPRSPRPWARTIRARVSRKIGTKRDRSRPESRTVLTRSPRPWARTTSTTVTSPMGEDDQHHGHLTHGRGRPAPRSPRPWERMTSTTVTSPMGEDDQHHGHLVHGRGRFAPGSPRPRARTIQS